MAERYPAHRRPGCSGRGSGSVAPRPREPPLPPLTVTGMDADDSTPDLADRRWFGLDEDAWESFNAELNRPARDTPRLRELLSRPSTFED